MKYIILHIAFLVLLFGNTQYGFSNDKELPEDKSEIVVKRPSRQALEKYKQDSDFEYREEAPDQDDLLMQFKCWLADLLSDPTTNEVIKYTIYAIIVITFILVIAKLANADLTTIFLPGSSQKKGINLNVMENDIHAIDIDAQLKTAINEGNYRLAVRYLYLKLLKSMTDADAIQWSIYKTDRDYQSELKTTSDKRTFGRLSSIYNYVWYGEFSLAQEHFDSIYKGYLSFLERFSTNNSKK